MTESSPVNTIEAIEERTNLELAVIDLITQAAEYPSFELHPAIRERDPNIVAKALIWANNMLRQEYANRFEITFEELPINFVNAATVLYLSHQKGPLTHGAIEIGLIANITEQRFFPGYCINEGTTYRHGAQRLALHIMSEALRLNLTAQETPTPLVRIAHMIAEIPKGPHFFLEGIFESDWFLQKGLTELIGIFIEINNRYLHRSKNDLTDTDNLQSLMMNMWIDALDESESSGNRIQEILEHTLLLLHSSSVMHTSVIASIPTNPKAINPQFIGAISNYWDAFRNGASHVEKTTAGSLVVREAKRMSSRQL